MQSLAYDDGFDLHGNEPLGETQFRMNGFAQRLILTQRKKATQKYV